MQHSADYDLCIIGGGINGAGVARDAAGRGLSVLLVEAGDLAQGTSSASTKLIHGGLRYLEHYDFKLVREALKERSRLLKLAPHIIWPLDFVLPHDPSMRPAWMIRLGLFLYDHLAPSNLFPRSKSINFQDHAFGAPLETHYKKGFSYADCWAEDSRLVVLNAMDARNKGADIITHTACTKLEARDGRWHVQLENNLTQARKETTASMVVNAAGPWADQVLQSSGLNVEGVPKLRLVKGSHIIVRKAYEGDQAYILQQPDGRIVFVIPYEYNYLLVGTTEEDFSGDPSQASITNGEVDYLCAAFSHSFQKQIKAQDVVWAYSGVRPLFDGGGGDQESASKVSREHHFDMQDHDGAFLLSIFGGKLTTYRLVAEQVVDQLMNLKKMNAQPWTDKQVLPGGDITNFEAFLQKKYKRYSWLPQGLVYRYARAYGTAMEDFLKGAGNESDLGAHYGDGLYEAEMRYLISKEWARSAEDILWRRSKMGLHVRDETVERLAAALPDLLRKGAA